MLIRLFREECSVLVERWGGGVFMRRERREKRREGEEERKVEVSGGKEDIVIPRYESLRSRMGQEVASRRAFIAANRSNQLS